MTSEDSNTAEQGVPAADDARKIAPRTSAKTVDLSEDRLFPLGWGFIFRVVCAPSSWDEARISDEMTAIDPPGTSANRWVVSTPDKRDDAFDGINHVPCPDDCNRTHWLMNC